MKLLARNKIFALLSLSRFLNTLGAAIYNLVFVVFACQYAATEPSSWHCQSHCIYS